MIGFPAGMTSQDAVDIFAQSPDTDIKAFNVALLVAELVKISTDPDKTAEDFGELIRPIRHDVEQFAMVTAMMAKLIAGLEIAQESRG